MNLEEFIGHTHERLAHLFTRYLTLPPAGISTDLNSAMQYAVLNGGKRLRPLLVYLVGHALNVSLENLDAAACAIELIHTYSLIHDDLPAMDNADLRRGKPTCHIKYNEATAILAGDALQPLAFELITTHATSLTANQRLATIRALCQACGTQGIAYGQAVDLIGVNNIPDLIKLYHYKTSALFIACVEFAAIAANSSATGLIKYADCLGIAFQIQDDILDIAGTTEQLGKPQGLDEINKKNTYPALTSLSIAQTKINSLRKEALAAIAYLGPASKLLEEFAYYLLPIKN
jgi:farnesyl diphosphate synthase